VVQRWRIGLTGGIGSGKSTVARVWQAMGAEVLDADAIAKQVTEAQGRAMPALLAAFGPDCMATDGAMDRVWMRARVLEQPGERQRLEQILHPLIGEEMRQAAARCTAPVLIFDVPLLVESTRWRVQLDHVVVVDCTRSTQIERVVRRSGWSAQQVERIIDQQATRAERLRAADSVLFNQDIDISTLEQRVRQLGQRFGLSSPD
jgi:dephospho-CoA kinase